MVDTKLNRAWRVLRIGLGAGPILAGLDKYFNILTNWEMYLNPLAPRLLHLRPTTFMHIVGVVEMLAGIFVLTRYTRYAAYVVMVWLWCIAASLVAQWGFLDVAVRDIEISLAAFALAVLSEAREAESQGLTTTTRSTMPRRSAA